MKYSFLLFSALALTSCTQFKPPVAHTVHLNTPVGPLNLSSEAEGCQAFQAFEQDGKVGIKRTERIIPAGQPTRVTSMAPWYGAAQINMEQLVCGSPTDQELNVTLPYTIAKDHTNVYLYLSPSKPTAEQQRFLASKWHSEIHPLTIGGQSYYSISFTE